MNFVSMLKFVKAQYAIATTSHKTPMKGEVLQHKATVMDRCQNYTHLLERRPIIGMFVPCDNDGNFLEEPLVHFAKNKNSFLNNSMGRALYNAQYKQAKNRVLFEGFEIVDYSNSSKKCVFQSSGSQTVAAMCVDNDAEGWRPAVGIHSLEDLTDKGLTLTKKATDKILR